MLDPAQSRMLKSHRACKILPDHSAPPGRNALHPRAGPVEEMGRPERQHPDCTRDVALVSTAGSHLARDAHCTCR